MIFEHSNAYEFAFTAVTESGIVVAMMQLIPTAGRDMLIAPTVKKFLICCLQCLLLLRAIFLFSNGHISSNRYDYGKTLTCIFMLYRQTRNADHARFEFSILSRRILSITHASFDGRLHFT